MQSSAKYPTHGINNYDQRVLGFSVEAGSTMKHLVSCSRPHGGQTMLTAVQHKSVIALLSPLVLLLAIADTCRLLVMGTQR